MHMHRYIHHISRCSLHSSAKSLSFSFDVCPILLWNPKYNNAIHSNKLSLSADISCESEHFYYVSFQVRLMHEAGYDIGNLDATLILQRPKLSPHKEVIRSNLCELLGADPSVINLKAKTHVS